MSEKLIDLLEITRRKGMPGLSAKQRKLFNGLGLSKNGRKVLLEDTNAVRGMVNHVINWVDVKMVPAKEAGEARKHLQAEKERKPPSYRVIKK